MKDWFNSEHTQAILWMCAFVGVCVLVGLGKLQPSTVEMLLMAVVGASRPFGKGEAGK